MKGKNGLNILIVKLSAIGDVIHTLPALNVLRKHFPSAQITWLIEENAAEMVQNHRAIDRIIVSKRKHWISTLKHFDLSAAIEIHQFVRELRDTFYDLIIDFQALLKSGVLIGLARGRRKIGFDKGMEHMEHSYLFLNERIPAVSMEHHALQRSMMLLEALGIPAEKVEYNLPIGSEDHASAERLLKIHGVKPDRALFAINPVAKWKTKLWENDRFAKLAVSLIEQYNAEIIFTGSAEDFDTIQNILSGMNRVAFNFAGLSTLKVLAALYERADAVISTDTGPMHIASAVETPVVALFGPTAPWRTGPFGAKHRVIRVDLKCSPCFKRECETKNCMLQIDVDQILNGVKELGIG